MYCNRSSKNLVALTTCGTYCTSRDLSMKQRPHIPFYKYYVLIHFIIQDGTTPLLKACKHKQIEAAVKLIDSNASLNEVDEVIELCAYSCIIS